MHLLDTHCHLDTYSDPLAVLARARESQVNLVAVTDNPGDFRRLRTRIGRTAGVSVAVGLHPGSTAASAPGQLQRFFRMLPNAEWIGEIGLDYGRNVDARARRNQYSTLAAILDHDLARTVPMTIHSRGAAADTIAVLDGTGARAILHWFTGTPKQAAQGADSGLWFSVNSAMVDTKSGASLVSAVPPERILLETDGPYCTWRGRPAEPRDLPGVLERVARLLGVRPDEARFLLSDNTRRFLEPTRSS